MVYPHRPLVVVDQAVFSRTNLLGVPFGNSTLNLTVDPGAQGHRSSQVILASCLVGVGYFLRF